MKNNTKILQASLLVALSGILYGFLGFLGSKLLDENLSISTMLFWRFLIAGIWMLPFVIKKAPSKWYTLDKRLIIVTLFLGAIGYAGSSGFYFMASERIGTGIAMVIFFAYPIIIALASWLNKKSNFNILTLSMLFFMMLGLFLLRDPSEHSTNILGISFAIAASASYAFYIIGSKKYASVTVDSNTLTLLVSFGCAFIFLVFSILTGTFSFPTAPRSWLYLLALGIFVTAIPIQLMLEGLKQISSMRASIISVLEPLVTVFVGVLWLEESISSLQLVGALIILGSTMIIQFQREV